MSKLHIDGDKCKACGYCINNCPKQALYASTHINAKGYVVVAVDAAKCICCGICYKVCPDQVFEIYEEEKCQNS